MSLQTASLQPQLLRAQKLAKLFYAFMIFDIIAAALGIAFVLFYRR